MLRHGCPETILVCMPTYHSDLSWLVRSTESLRKQIYHNFECWVVKDGCSEACTFTKLDKTCIECENCGETDKFFRSLCVADSRFRYFRMPVHHSGAGWGPRNFAIMNTNHRLISYLDDDNWLEPNHLSSLYWSITKSQSEMCYTGTKLYDQNMRVIAERLHNDLPRQGYIDTSEIMHTRSLIDTHGGWRYVKKCNDWDMVSRWVPNVKWSHTNELTLNFFVREGCGIHRK